MSVSVRLHAMFTTDAVAKSGVVILPYTDGLTIGSVLHHLQLHPKVVGVILLNGTVVRDTEASVPDNGRLDVYPIFGGG